MKRIIAAGLLLLICAISCFTADDHRFAAANDFYLKGKYAEAVKGYEALLGEGFESGELFFNTGNAYYKLGNIQKTVLNYERAKRLLGRDEDLEFNLQLVNLLLVDKIDTVPQLFFYTWIESLLSIVPLRTLGWIVYTFFLLMLLAFGLFLFVPSYSQRRLTLFAGMINSGILFIVLALFIAQSYRENNLQYGIVMTDVANVKSAPDKKGNDAFVLHRGLKVQVLDEVNRWRKIRLSDGKVGWLPTDECEII